MEEQGYTIQEVEVTQPTSTPPSDATSAVIIAVVSAIASITTVALQVLGTRQNKKESDKHTEQADENAEDIKKLLKDNADALKRIDTNLKANSQATVATARASIKRIYNQLAPERKITISDKAMVMELYHAYKGVVLPDGHIPNSFCDAAIKDIETWEVVPDGLIQASTKSNTRRKTNGKK